MNTDSLQVPPSRNAGQRLERLKQNITNYKFCIYTTSIDFVDILYTRLSSSSLESLTLRS